MKIDIYAHLIPPKFKDLVLNNSLVAGTIGNAPATYDLDIRFHIMDKYPDVVQVLTFPGATVDELAKPGEAIDLAKRINDELAELVHRYPTRFAASAAVLPVSNIEASLKEIDRCINDLKMRGILLRIPVNGKAMDRPEIMPVYEKMCQHNLPIWFHPHKSPKVPDYPDETESKYVIWHTWGLIYETTVSMTRLVFSGVMEKYPKLKIITHHCGAMIPFFSERIINHYYEREMCDRMNYTKGLPEPPLEYFRRFYNDTAILGNPRALMCAHEFFGPEHLLFGTDTPFDAYQGDYGTRHTIQAITQMDIPETDKKKIFEENAKKLLRIYV